MLTTPEMIMLSMTAASTRHHQPASRTPSAVVVAWSEVHRACG